jgi:hypothetical protein
VFELAMTTFGANQIPAIIFKKFDNVSDFHKGIVPYCFVKVNSTKSASVTGYEA